MPSIRFTLLVTAFLPILASADEQLTIAVASNFAPTAEEIVAEFSKATNISARISSGSTGKLYAQIINGAPYDVFLAADEDRPKQLELTGHAVAGTRATYAIGALVLWSADASMQDRDCRAALETGDFNHLAIANPATAPYGRAAREFLISAGLWDSVLEHTVYGENISQALQFAATGNAALGLLARSQIRGELPPAATCVWPVPASSHSSISQQAVAIENSRNPESAMRFLNFLNGPEVAAILDRRGYGLPQ